MEEILELSAPYIHRDYVGDPPLALGTAAVLVVLWLALPGLGPSGESSVWAQMRAVLLGQT